MQILFSIKFVLRCQQSDIVQQHQLYQWQNIPLVSLPPGGTPWLANISANFRSNLKWPWCYFQRLGERWVMKKATAKKILTLSPFNPFSRHIIRLNVVHLSHKFVLWSAMFVACALQRQFRLYIPFLGIARPQPQFSHSCVFERFINSQDQSTYFLRQNRQTHRGNM